MTVRVPVRGIVAGAILLDPAASRHVGRVLRARRGDAIVLFDPDAGVEAEATVAAVSRRGVRCEVGRPRAASRPALRRIALVHACGKRAKTDVVVRAATELGVARILVAETSRTIVRSAGGVGDPPGGRAPRWRRIADEAARQSGRDRAPEVRGPLAWSAALREAIEPGAAGIVLWERAVEPASAILRALDDARPVAVAIGPEGGLSEAEIDDARAAGYAPVSVGPLVLRTETAAIAAVGAVVILCGRAVVQGERP